MAAWSLLNGMRAEEVEALIAHEDNSYDPDIVRFFPREKALAIVRSAIWGYAARQDSTAGAYAFMNLIEALGLKGWTFDQEEADALQRFRNEKNARRP